MSPFGRFVVVIEMPNGNVMLMKEDEDTTSRFDTAAEAKAATVGAIWEHAWVWWIAELADGGRVVHHGEL